jgi:hypothetical protein
MPDSKDLVVFEVIDSSDKDSNNSKKGKDTKKSKKNKSRKKVKIHLRKTNNR